MNFIFGIIIIPGDIILITIVALLVMSIFNKYKVNKYKLNPKYRPTISLIVPAHNEEGVIERTIKAFLKVDYPNSKKEMIIINDGSKDKTKQIVLKYADTVINTEDNRHHPNTQVKNLSPLSLQHSEYLNKSHITLINRNKGGRGKAFASNEGGKIAKGNILFFIDADIEIDRNAFKNAAKHLEDKKVGALAGYVHVRKNKSILNGFLRFESVMAQKVMRSGFNVLGVHYIIPGGCAIFKRKLWKSVGMYSSNSLAEDTDLTWKVLTETNFDIRFDDTIKVYADEPQTMPSLWNQRLRWARGNLEVTLNHKYKIGKTKYGKGVTYLYIFWLATILVPIVFLFSSISILVGILLNINLSILILLSKLVGLSFYINWIIGLIVNKGDAALEGLISPGIPMLILFTVSLLLGKTFYLMLYAISPHWGLLILSWSMISIILISLCGTYFTIWIAKKSTFFNHVAEILQLVIFGYWLLLVTSVLEGYFREFIGSERKWIRTQR